MKTSLITLVLGIVLGLSANGIPVLAQPPSSRGDGERGSDRDRGDRDRGDRDRGDRDRGDRDRGGDDRGGFRGGPPGGFPGGGPSGGSRGGFDPSSFVDRLDRNGNGMLDPDEMEGPAGFMVSRLQREDPSIRTDRPIPISKFKEAFDRMRSGRESGDSSGGSSGDSDRSREDTTAKINEAMTAPPLVPGFGGAAPVLSPVLGFGPSAELMSVEVSPADLKEAEERLARYDKNKDGFLSGDELSSRWSGNPLDFDRNGDSKLSVSELAVRAARLRLAQQQVASTQQQSDPNRRRDRSEKPAEIADPYKGRKSFATASRVLPEGLPGWFVEKDLDQDQQVSMAEYTKQWTDSMVAEFESFDLNRDGFITPQECLAAVRGGATATQTGSASSSASASSSGSSMSWRTTSSVERPSSPAGGPSAGAAGKPDDKTLEYATRNITRYDKNKDSVLTADEWKDMLVDPSPADANKDGRITVEEYATWMQMRSAR